jgi:hypothetical protein
MWSDAVRPLPDALPTGEPNLDSFVLRFVRADGAGWHGVIRHVQSNRERAFNRWGDAVSFINDFVCIEEPRNDRTRGSPAVGIVAVGTVRAG